MYLYIRLDRHAVIPPFPSPAPRAPTEKSVGVCQARRRHLRLLLLELLPLAVLVVVHLRVHPRVDLVVVHKAEDLVQADGVRLRGEELGALVDHAWGEEGGRGVSRTGGG